MLKRSIFVASLMSITTVLGLGGGVSYLWISGTLNSESAGRIAAILSGKEPDTPPEIKDSAILQVTAPSSAPPTRDALDVDKAWASHLRYVAELDQRRTAMQLEMVRLEKKREEIKHDQERLAGQLKARDEIEDLEGFRKELELLGQMKSKQALDFLLAKAPNDAAHYLLKLETRVAKKVVESARGEEEKSKIHDILERMRDMSSDETVSRTESVPPHVQGN